MALKYIKRIRVYGTVEIETGDTNLCQKGEVWNVPFNEIIFLERPKLLKNKKA
ncbi:hypothetical protein [Aequorivita sp. CIP111184]|uniref:hypothetical protein n=1 Tax=Aequorivita sp. CIP111184 TaxID=2211356 RepID=UPI0015EC86CC|nr:hypothetical protein [Aequorivita sp. CIP111184]